MKYHYIFSGLGLSSLLVLHEMMQNNFLVGKSILIIEPETKDTNDRTWCFWEKGKGNWDPLVRKQWESAFFLTENHKKECLSEELRYKMLESQSFYSKIIPVLKDNKNIVFVKDKVCSFRDNGAEVFVNTPSQTFVSEYFFNAVSVIDAVTSQTKYPLLKQHFIGWFVKTKAPVFSPDSVHFMDFSVSQNENTRFMYVLPFSATEALVEYTLFSPNELKDNEYEKEIKNYILNKGALDFEVIAKERGVIPMTAYPFWKNNTQRILHIGTAGGWTKASTGYTFKNATKQAKRLVNTLQQDTVDFRNFKKSNRFLFYDTLFVSVLYQNNELGKEIFSEMFTKVAPDKILRFLDEESTFMEELEIIWACPKIPFLKALVKYFFFEVN
ncbi:lycopene cyclase family protein [Flavobacterium amnicola]|uniref:lycopene cyclase family protein n=1 Tax=Flavobacterium amnicola TaxID=2506422 RepID=UPI0013E99117|nr:lycopene cyclase family protein [Flavobacterium amnicola]